MVESPSCGRGHARCDHWRSCERIVVNSKKETAIETDLDGLGNGKISQWRQLSFGPIVSHSPVQVNAFIFTIHHVRCDFAYNLTS